MFELTESRIEVPVATNDATGAQVVFTGLVRDHSEGRKVVRLEYEAMPNVALKEGSAVLDEARRLFEVYDVRCTHRVGEIPIGEAAVVALATAAHRHAAFSACRYVIEEVKRRVPIWKRETYADGTVEWVNAVEQTGNGIAVLLDSLEAFREWSVIDVRDDDEREAEPITSIEHRASPSGSFDRSLLCEGRTLLVCASGVRALLLADDLIREGHTGVHALTGGCTTIRHIERKHR